jgi:SET domain-containing protein
MSNNKIFTKIEKLNKNFKNVTDEFSFVLKPSSIAGVGVFATHGITKGTRLRLFYGKNRMIPIAATKNNPVLKKFTDFFGVEENGAICVAENFSHMSVGWYLNHSDKYNAIHDEQYRYFADRNIKAGEEITINYNDL